MSIKQCLLQQLKKGGHVRFILQYIGDQGMNKLYNIPECQDILSLMLTHNQIGSDGFVRFPKQPWKNLKYLYINSNLIGDRGCKYLSQAHLKISVLIASDNKIGNAGTYHLSKADWPQLSRVNLQKNMVDGEGLRVLLRGNWGQIRAIYLDYDMFTKGQLISLFLSEIKGVVAFNINKKSGSKNLIVKMKRKLTKKFGQIQLDYR